VLRNLLHGPILAGAPEGDAVPCEVQPDRCGLLGGILSSKLASKPAPLTVGNYQFRGSLIGMRRDDAGRAHERASLAGSRPKLGCVTIWLACSCPQSAGPS
jgi:hypothetical protein